MPRRATSLHALLWSALLFACPVTSAQRTSQDSANEPRPVEDSDEWAPSAGQNGLPLGPTQSLPDIVPRAARTAGEWIVVPIPSYNPSQRLGVSLKAQYIFHPPGAGGKPDIIGFGVGGTEKGSYGGGGAYIGHFDNDRWRFVGAGGFAQYKYDYYGIGNEAGSRNESIPVLQKTAHVFLVLARQLWKGWYLGPRIHYQSIDATAHDIPEDLRADLPADGAAQQTQVSLGAQLQYDTRDNNFYPTRGSFFNATADYFDNAFGAANTFSAYQFAYNRYLGYGADDVLALRALLRMSYGDVPYYELSRFGSRSDLRGYKSGRYRDRMMYAAQGEFRHRLNTKWSGAVFAGLGAVAPQVNQLWQKQVLWSIGGGIRYRLGERNPVDLRLDVGWGRDGTATYLGVGQAF